MGPAVQHPRRERVHRRPPDPDPGQPAEPAPAAVGLFVPPRCVHSDKVAGDLCSTERPELLPASSGTAHLKRCHLADPVGVYQTEVLPEIAPELVEETR